MPGSYCEKVSRCELEVDVIAEDILNEINVESCIGHNPGITAMWEDERQRRRDIGLSSQVALPVSQEGSDDEHDEDIDEDKESILMSQPFWKDDEEEHDSQSFE
ncbi:DNA polymerase zeta catalytic subunit-like isoform X3 [Xenia sp. Carnegie-2017]|uniref:DNA polymerase zeta catalytic subunit-like isoform X3 n=1 Tax=Xenia sp. Carnegie-2017 TaxID=2897299 RepID=UPI001F03B3C3|nr:DNA polymerase zeta catalytic subunit-like isoform X3 [Xenia sp. Carnegie-2017]